jgi:DNA-binding transcriptional ArsR family regulator
MNLTALQSRAEAAETLLKAMANKNRLMILCQLQQGEQSVTALQPMLGLSQSALSQHLARLREDGLVKTRREAQSIHYRLSGDEVTKVIATLYAIYCQDAETDAEA